MFSTQLTKPHLIISLDYELFFGPRTGSVEKCLLEPTDALLQIAKNHHKKLSFFVDIGFIRKMKHEAKKFAVLRRQYENIVRQLKGIGEKGHDIQLHIHPHWEDSLYDGEKWVVNTKRYRLQDFKRNEIKQIVKTYKGALESIAGHDVFAHRGGGWCVQPFGKIKDALKDAEIWIDSTVFPNGKSEDATRWFDFSGCSEKPYWRFDDDPTREASKGYFLEIPISSFCVNPGFFWKMAFCKKLVKGQHEAFGDGTPMSANAQFFKNLLLKKSFSVASIDGLKAGLLDKALAQNMKRKHPEIFNIMGHPKALSKYSLKEIDRFLTQNQNLNSMTFQTVKHLRN